MPVDPIMSALPAQILNLPAQLADAAAPVSVSGIVAESPIPGQLRITTAVGEVQLRTATELPPGRAVTIVTRPNVPTEVFLLPNASPAPQAAAKPVPGAPLPTAPPMPTGPAPQATPALPGHAAPP